LAIGRSHAIIDRVADALWGPDGTQPPPAPKAWNDPVAGLVTGGVYESEPFQIELVEPAMPDLAEVRRAVDAVLAGEDEPQPAAKKVPAPRRQPVIRDTPGIVPPNPRAGWPRTPSVRQLPGLRPRQQPPPPPPQRGQVRRSQGSNTGIGVVIVIVVVVIVIVVTIINSLLDTLSTLFS
jgi:hypothetical protein